MLRRIARISLKIIALVFILHVVAIVILLNTGETLSLEVENTIQDVSRAPLPELITGNTGYAKNGDVSIWFESIEPAGEKKGTVVLMMGAAGSAIFWPQFFLDSLVNQGYQVIRYDYRGVGMSDWMQDWSKGKAYDLSAMSTDVVCILDQLEVKQAHILGISMGGIIARHFVVTYPERALSLTSISSMGLLEESPDTKKFDLSILQIIRHTLRHGIWPGDDEEVRFIVGIIHLMNGDSIEPLNYKMFAEQAYYELRKRRGFNTSALRQHFHAISLSADKLDDITKSDKPVLVVHGTRDRVAPYQQAVLFAQRLPNAKFLALDGVGHVFPQTRLTEVMDVLLSHLHNAAQSPSA